MLRKRKIQVNLVKEPKTKPGIEEPTGATFEQKAIIIGRMLERSIKKLTIAVVVVVLADTIRKVAVEQASQSPEE